MKVSVILPVHNGERYLADALQSVLEQTRPPDQIVVVDDGSIDRSAQIIKGFGAAFEVIYLFQEKKGPAAARNSGLERATGDLVAFLDCDDLWAPGHLEQALTVLLDREVDLTQGLIVQTRLDGDSFVFQRGHLSKKKIKMCF